MIPLSERLPGGTDHFTRVLWTMFLLALALIAFALAVMHGQDQRAYNACLTRQQDAYALAYPATYRLTPQLADTSVCHKVWP